MTDDRTAPYGALILRVSMGLMFLAHFSVKLFIFTPTGTAQYFTSLGLPSGLAYVVMTAELFGAVALLLGIWTRIVAVALTPILAGAIATVHGANGWLFTNPNGGWEYLAFWIVGLVALAMVGDGAWALRPTPHLARFAEPRGA